MPHSGRSTQVIERVFLVGVAFRPAPLHGASAPGETRSPAASLAELAELARGAGAEIAGEISQIRPAPDPAYLIGRGKLDELRAVLAGLDASSVIFDHDLTPTQQRNLEQALEIRVVDRTQLILDIFARHARTREGQLQVELAQLQYRLPRLSGRGVEMSRLGGGIGTRGPGETQLESDRRRIQQRIRGLRLNLEAVRRQRQRQRQLRESVPLATVALVGYTNAGKSTLFNALTGAGVYASARMFATLDPTLRAISLPSHRRILLSDTVGFLRQLPHGLIEAFRATLEEVRRAHLLLLVSDITAPDREEQVREVRKVLAELGVADRPLLEVWNKIDLLPGPIAPPVGAAAPLRLSARSGAGIPELLSALDSAITLDPAEPVDLELPHAAGELLHRIYEHGVVLARESRPAGIRLHAVLPHSLQKQLAMYRVNP